MSKKKEKEELEEEKIKLRIRLKAFDPKIIDKSCKEIIEMAIRYGATIKGPIPLPTEIYRYTVNRSTFVHKDSREQFEMRIHKRLIDIIEPPQAVIEGLRDLTLPTGVEIEIKTTV